MSLERAIEQSKSDESFLLEKVIIPKEKLSFVLSLKSVNEYFFLGKAFIENDIQGSKAYLYKMGMVNSYYSEIGSRDIFEVVNTFTFPILSDSSTLISRYLTYEPIQYFDAFSTFFGQAVQSVMKKDNLSLERSILGLEKHSKGGWEKNFEGMVTAFKGILNKDKDKVEQGIYELLGKHDNQGHPPITKEYINYEATTIAKLALQAGINIEVDHSLVPKGLLQVNELENYKGYPFFDELPNIE
ncbi:immunity 49 family protein [Reichenbachiella agarivorans]|uniref:Immunity 49 family protein n=1 Tax=Reichenbachiella agarivorans TaxID=2979464 RepID=A0ABY6CRM9_9BACT|nr:immunity 49 family protein [Reichenbachiella agarivorans]UXP33177.1 immunity 49 family protein [Reichenbachiella agarivorans]